MFYEPADRDPAVLPHDPIKALIAPRPIGWVSTMAPDGAINLAPYSHFNAVNSNPPMLAFASTGRKDSMTFAGARGEFVWNMPTMALAEAMNETSRTVPRGVNEFATAELEMAPCVLVAAPRVAASPCSMECKVLAIHELRDLEGRAVDGHLVIGQVVGVHLDESLIVDGKVDTTAARPIARCGYLDEYTVVERLFHMPRLT